MAAKKKAASKAGQAKALTKTAAGKRASAAAKAEPAPKKKKTARAKKLGANDTATTFERATTDLAPAKKRKTPVPSTQWLAADSSERTFERVTRSSHPPPAPAVSVTVLPDTPSMLSLSAILDDAQSEAVWEKRWGALVRVAKTGRPAAGNDVAVVVAWGKSLGRISEDVLEKYLPIAANGVPLGNALIALLRAGAAREAISVAKQLVDACAEHGYDGPYATSFVSQVFAAATFVDGEIRDEVLEWALDLRCAPDPTVFFNRACALALAGRAKPALQNVRLAREHGVPAHVFRSDTDFARIAKHPDFERALG